MEFKVEKENTLLPFLLENMQDKSRNTVKSFLTHGQVSVNGCSTTRHNAQLMPGDIVTTTKERTGRALVHSMLRIVFEDEHLIVADKRNGLLSIATDKEPRKTAFYILSEHIKRENPLARLFVVHRLDRETSGLIIYAKSQNVQETLQKNWKDMVLDRRYVAVVEGRLPNAEGVIDTLLREDKSRKMWAAHNGDGERAVTSYRVLKVGKEYSLVELSLETGKKNQIRAHLEYINAPIAGDEKYGAQTNPAARVCLHAYRICFIHPATGEKLDFSTGIPRLFESTVR